MKLGYIDEEKPWGIIRKYTSPCDELSVVGIIATSTSEKITRSGFDLYVQQKGSTTLLCGGAKLEISEKEIGTNYGIPAEIVVNKESVLIILEILEKGKPLLLEKIEGFEKSQFFKKPLIERIGYLKLF
ncbi:MAG: hypothetical protein QXX38_01930 [Candidatus Aenigmatarchaeota archaeon]